MSPHYETDGTDEANGTDEADETHGADIRRRGTRWWPKSLGESPNSVGGQNSVRYAYFGDKHRLAVDTGDGKVGVYDTGGQIISGVQQAQGGDKRKIVFSGSQGEIDLDQLKKVSAED